MARKLKAPPGYIRFGTRYILKTYLIALSLVLCALAVLYATVLHPVAVRRWYAMQEKPEFKLDSPYLAEYTGNARLVLSDGTLLYDGMVESAAANGVGSLYKNGELIYEGSFGDNQFSGYGKLFENGELIYEGDFILNEFSGAGKRYENGFLKYEGSFIGGQYNGAGIEYKGGGAEVYTGNFTDGLLDGMGTHYINGLMVYTGGFLAGQYSGTGKQYGTDGKLIYEGDFLSGMYDGKGKQFRNGVLLYDGEFAAGKYNGTGTEYDTKTGFPVFSGKYSDGIRMKAGILYDENGEPIIAEENPLPRPDPISLLGWSYFDTLTYFAQAEIAITEQTTDDTHFVIDDEIGVMYGFCLDETGAADYLSGVYYYGLLSAGGIVVGADISDIHRQSSGQVKMNASDLLVLIYANALWGLDATVAKSQGLVYSENGLTITAFYLPPESPVSVISEPGEMDTGVLSEPVDTEPAMQPEPSGRILFLRIDYTGKG